MTKDQFFLCVCSTKCHGWKTLALASVTFSDMLLCIILITGLKSIMVHNSFSQLRIWM